jgi:hypothetical protein
MRINSVQNRVDKQVTRSEVVKTLDAACLFANTRCSPFSPVSLIKYEFARASLCRLPRL